MIKKAGHINFLFFHRVLLLLLLFVTFGSNTVEASISLPDGKETVYTLTTKENSQAYFSDSSHLLRICSTRPARLISSSFAKFKYLSDRNQQFFNLQIIRYRYYNGCGCFINSPILPAPSCEYYVFMLGHLLC